MKTLQDLQTQQWGVSGTADSRLKILPVHDKAMKNCWRQLLDSVSRRGRGKGCTLVLFSCRRRDLLLFCGCDYLGEGTGKPYSGGGERKPHSNNTQYIQAAALSLFIRDKFSRNKLPTSFYREHAHSLHMLHYTIQCNKEWQNKIIMH